MENKLSVSPFTMGHPDIRSGSSRDRAFRRHSSSTCTPPRSPIFLIHKPPSTPGTPGDLGSTDSNISISDKHLLSPLNRRFSTKKVCTMDCPNCRNMAAQKLRAESPNYVGFLSAPCSRKSSMASGKKIIIFTKNLSSGKLSENFLWQTNIFSESCIFKVESGFFLESLLPTELSLFSLF